MPSDPSADWLLQDRNRGFDLQLEGKLVASSPDQIRVQRGGGAPDAILFLRPETLYLLDGKAVSVTQLPLGAPVHAVFDLDGNVRMARRIEAVQPGDEAAAAQLGESTLPPFTSEVPGMRVEQQLPPNLLPAAPPTEGLEPGVVRSEPPSPEAAGRGAPAD